MTSNDGYAVASPPSCRKNNDTAEVSANFAKHSDKKLARWVPKQRVFKNRGTLETVRIKRLEELGFVWKAKKPKKSPQTKSSKKKKGRFINEPQILPGEKQKPAL